VNLANPANTARAYTLSAATDLYGFCSPEYRAVQDAWDAVGVAGSDGNCADNHFSISLSSRSGSVDPGGSVTVTVNTAVTSGSAVPVPLAAQIPPGFTASFDPPRVTVGTPSTLRIPAPSTSSAYLPFAIYVSAASANTASAEYALTINPPPPLTISLAP